MGEEMQKELEYRRQMQITEVFISDGGDAFPVCPRCRVSFDAEYQKYCANCGQCLKWNGYSDAAMVYSRNRTKNMPLSETKKTS